MGEAVVLEVAPALQRVSVGAVCPCGPSLVLGERGWLGLLLLPGQQAGGEALSAARLHVRPHGGDHLVSVGRLIGIGIAWVAVIPSVYNVSACW